MQIHEKQRDLENAQLYVEEAQSKGRHESGDPFCRKKCCKLYDIAQKKCDKLYVTKKSIVTK